MGYHSYDHSIFYMKVDRVHGKPGNLSLTFRGLENAWNLLKKCENDEILTQNPEEEKLKSVNSVFQYVLFKIAFTNKISFTSLS